MGVGQRTAMPLTAQTSGLLRSMNASTILTPLHLLLSGPRSSKRAATSATPGGSTKPSATLTGLPLWSAPLQKPRPEPVSTTTSTLSSASAASKAAMRSWYIRALRALSTSGRCISTVRMPSSDVQVRTVR